MPDLGHAGVSEMAKMDVTRPVAETAILDIHVALPEAPLYAGALGRVLNECTRGWIPLNYACPEGLLK